MATASLTRKVSTDPQLLPLPRRARASSNRSPLTGVVAPKREQASAARSCRKDDLAALIEAADDDDAAAASATAPSSS